MTSANPNPTTPTAANNLDNATADQLVFNFSSVAIGSADDDDGGGPVTTSDEPAHEHETEEVSNTSPDVPKTTSSLGHEFIIVGDDSPFVSGVAADTSGAGLDAATRMVSVWEHENAVVLADFEGEQMGWGGEVLTAQFLRTDAIDRTTLKPVTVASADGDVEPGLLVDMRSNVGIEVVRMVMENTSITKLIWGADGDLISLRYSLTFASSGINATRVVDVQLGFSVPGRRLGMARAIESLPRSATRGLPSKSQLEDRDFYAPQARNRRCVTFPMPPQFTRYSVDDLHRIEAILRAKRPPTGSYRHAESMTARTIADLDGARSGVEWLSNESRYFARKYGQMKHTKAVQMARAARHIEIVFGDELTSAQRRTLANIRGMVLPSIQSRGVRIPANLHFAV